MHIQGDPGGYVIEGQPSVFGLLAFQDQRQAFLFTEAADHFASCRDVVIGQGAEHVITVIEVRAHTAQQGCQGGFASHVRFLNRGKQCWSFSRAYLYKKNQYC